MSTVTITNADCLDALRDLPDTSVDSVVTDPPYGLSQLPAAAVIETLTAWASGDREFMPAGKGFMGKSWDGFVPPPAVWDEVYRVLKPGGHLLAFAGSRTQDLMGISIRMADFEIRDSIAWLYGTGWPKSLDVSKGIDKAAGATRKVTGKHPAPATTLGNGLTMSGGDARESVDITAPATDAAREWDGWGTALKPAHEPIIMARKPLEGTVVANVLAHGTGALNIGANRIGTGGGARRGPEDIVHTESPNNVYGNGLNLATRAPLVEGLGRWPANVILDEHAADLVDAQSGVTASSTHTRNNKARTNQPAKGDERAHASSGHADTGGASRFFYVAKAPKAERPNVDGVRHPTVKPLTLMRHLIRLVTPAGGTVLEPFAGSGTTVEAALLEGFSVLAIERDPSYLPLIQARINRTLPLDAAA